MLDYSSVSNRLPGSGSVTRLTLLLLLSQGPSHGYGLRSAIESWRMDAWADIRYGSIYQVLSHMAEAGLVEEVGHSREGRRPSRCTYAITDSGREELGRLLRRAWATPSTEVQPVNVALCFVGFGLLGSKEIEDCLVERLSWLDQGERELASEERLTVSLSPGEGVARVLVDHFDHFHRLIATERAWATQVLEHLRAGEYGLTEGAAPEDTTPAVPASAEAVVQVADPGGAVVDSDAGARPW